MYIGLISDTHGTFADDVRSFLEPVDIIWHAGDFGGGVEFVDQLREFKRVIGVYGNMDGQDVRKEFPVYQCFECEGMKVLMTHIGLRRGSYWAYNPSRPMYDTYASQLISRHHPDIFVCGHSHIPQVFRDKFNGFLFMNPGACGFEGVTDVPRMALRFKIEGGQITDMEKCEFKY